MKNIKGFDGLRGISVIMVTLTHLGLKEYLDKNSFLLKHFGLINGSTFVQLFFVLSGFLITQVIKNTYYKGGKFQIKIFLYNRLLRLAPVVLIFSFILFLLELFNILPNNYTGIFISIISLNNFLPFRYYDIYIGHLWSLSLEDQFYILYAFTIKYYEKHLLIILSLFLILCFYCINIFEDISFHFNSKLYKLSNIFFTDRWFIPTSYPLIFGTIISLKSKLIVNFFKKYLIKNILFFFFLFFFFSEVLFPSFLRHYFIFQKLFLFVFFYYTYTLIKTLFLLKYWNLKY